MGESVFEMMIRAPLVALDPDAPEVLHAATMDDVCKAGLADPSPGVVPSACGIEGLKLAGTPDDRAVPWPPRASSLPETWKRCRACFDATGRKRPRSVFRVALG